jgi:hypothetical protein
VTIDFSVPLPVDDLEVEVATSLGQPIEFVEGDDWSGLPTGYLTGNREQATGVEIAGGASNRFAP